MYLNSLSLYLSSQYDRTGNPNDLELVLTILEDAFFSTTALPSIHIIAARRLLRILTDHGR
jgi:hypothetical protein